MSLEESLADYLVPRIKRHKEDMARLHLHSAGPVAPEVVEAHVAMLIENLRLGGEGRLRKLLTCAAENGRQSVQISLPESIIDEKKEDLEMLPAAYEPFIQAVRSEGLFIAVDYDDFGGRVTLTVGVSNRKLGRQSRWGGPSNDIQTQG